MKKILSIVLLLTVILPAAGYSASLSIGGTLWYATWTGLGSDFDKLGPEPLYGPAVTLGLNPQWSISSVFLTGVYEATTELSPGFIADLKIRRYDSDSALNYAVNRYFRVFGGFKYMKYAMEMRVAGSLASEGTHSSMGPALGFSVVLPLADNIFAIGSMSGMYLSGDSDGEEYTEPGYNTQINVAYSFTGAPVVLTAGYRYQYFKTVYDNSDAEDSKMKFYGFTVSALYTFTFE